MPESMEKDVVQACDPFVKLPESDPRCGCGLKEVLTAEEECILAKMREIKEQVRPIAEKLKDVQSHIGESSAVESVPEFPVLSGQLEELRLQWKDWEKKLEDAIERKLIMLGHRESRQVPPSI